MSINPFVFFLYIIHQFPFFPGWWWLTYSIGLLRFLWNPFSLHWTSSLVGKVLGSCLIPQPPFTVLEPWSKITCKLFWHCQIPYFSKWLIFSHMQNIMRQFFLNCRAKSFISLFCAFISHRGLFLWNRHCLEQMLLSFRRKITIILSLILPQEMNCRNGTVFFHNSIGLQKGTEPVCFSLQSVSTGNCGFYIFCCVDLETWLTISDPWSEQLLRIQSHVPSMMPSLCMTEMPTAICFPCKVQKLSTLYMFSLVIGFSAIFAFNVFFCKDFFSSDSSKELIREKKRKEQKQKQKQNSPSDRESVPTLFWPDLRRRKLLQFQTRTTDIL